MQRIQKVSITVLLFALLACHGCAAVPDAAVVRPFAPPSQRAEIVPESEAAPKATPGAATNSPKPIKRTQEELDAWWKSMISSNAQSQELSGEELDNLSYLAYLLSEARCYASADELSKFDILYPMGIYYNGAYANDTETMKSMLYPPDHVIWDDAREYIVDFIVSPENANAFAKAVLGADIPDIDEDFPNEYGYVTCENGEYHCSPGDYEACSYSVAAYQYLGNDMFYVSFDVDDFEIAGPYEDKVGVMPDATRFLVKRSDCAWGFTVVSKLTDYYHEDTAMQWDWELPNRLITAPLPTKTLWCGRFLTLSEDSPKRMPLRTAKKLERMMLMLSDLMQQGNMRDQLDKDGRYTYSSKKYDKDFMSDTVFFYAYWGDSDDAIGKDAVKPEYSDEEGIAKLSLKDAQRIIESFFGPAYQSRAKAIMDSYAFTKGEYHIELGDGFPVSAKLTSYIFEENGDVNAMFFGEGYDAGVYPIGNFRVLLKPYKASMFEYYIDSFEFESLPVSD